MPIDRSAVVERRGGAGWLIAIVLFVALLVGVFFLTRTSDSETAKDNAVADAASDVGNAAEQVGDAAKGASRPQ